MAMGGFFKGEKKKMGKVKAERKAQINLNSSTYVPPRVEIIKKGKKEW